ncbi:uncharacterized protein [Rutidosis leptorrhynchoides]|uniref:uncharacterized protein n=1 Tax=Rutidosis leptorrhynchoides TaxID=125765 RepID=UPI003A9A2065
MVLYGASQTQNPFNSNHRFKQNSFSRKSTIFVRGVPKSTSLANINYVFKEFGQIKGFGWKQGRPFVFIKFVNIDSAFNAIRSMNIALFSGRLVSVGFAKSDLVGEESQKTATPFNSKPGLLLIVEHDIQERMKMAALVIDREPIKADKLFN